MVAEALVIESLKEPLTPGMIEAGKALARRLEKRLSLTAAFWYYRLDANSWRLFLASPQVTTLGPRKVYRQVQAALLKMYQGASAEREYILNLEEITVIDDQHALVKLIRSAQQDNSVDGTDGTRITRSAINGQFIDDAYIYRLCFDHTRMQ